MNTLESIRATFWQRATRTSSGCLEWNGAKLVKGYGLIRMGSRWALAHRIAWLLSKGLIPEGIKVLHKCDNPPCIEPEHLFLGTQGDNNRDRSRKGRTRVPTGESQNFAKLDVEAVLKIRDMYSKGILKAHLAAMFKVDHGTIRAIVNRKTWKHVDA